VGILRPWVTGGWPRPAGAAAGPPAKRGAAAVLGADGTPTPSEASTAASKAADVTPGSPGPLTSSPTPAGRDNLILGEGASRFGHLPATDLPSAPLDCVHDAGGNAYTAAYTTALQFPAESPPSGFGQSPGTDATATPVDCVLGAGAGAFAAALRLPAASLPTGQPDAYPVSSHRLRRKTAAEEEDGRAACEVTFSASGSKVPALFLDVDQQADLSEPPVLRRGPSEVPVSPVVEEEAPRGVGLSPASRLEAYEVVPAPEDAWLRRGARLPPVPVLSEEDAAATATPESLRNHSGASPAKAGHPDIQLGDRVFIEGRSGVISWNGLPDHAFAAVRWDDDGQESEPLPLAEMVKVGSADGFAMTQTHQYSNRGAASEAVLDAGRLPLLC